ncbi:MAG: sigma 54-interacting transcriptional regulator, partial [Acidimicrobiales bacterium]|nr:sigma 54-interacting transcriptional regulator [Acidimicrobiales bacterium]
TYADPEVIHFGIVPRTNRGIFAINELPDLAERIQVGLLNVLEERDVQIRGHKVRLPLDMLVVATANPEDYTNRGRIITPLKDRYGAQIRTHYPLTLDDEIRVMESERGRFELGGRELKVPEFITEIVAEVTRLARESPDISQRSGVSVRMSVTNYEAMVASALRRSLRTGEHVVTPRVVDLEALAASTAGKVELETFDEGSEGKVFEHLVQSAILTTFRDTVDAASHRDVVEAFEAGATVATGEDISIETYAALLDEIPALAGPVAEVLDGEDDADHPSMVASAVEFVLEGLHLAKRLNKHGSGTKAEYRARS